MLKRKREIYEEVDSDADYEDSDAELDLDVFGMGWGLGEGDDKTVAGADKEADAKKRLKAISFPDMDADGLPSSYIIKVVNCLGKWAAKVQAVTDQLAEVKRIQKRAADIAAGIEKTTEAIQSKQADSVLNDVGFTLAQQDELKKLFDTAKKQPPDSS
ncbi:unnamed protein product [Symbiodinium sp. CCMP2456]|nr:unnamed protein product [Symbiodinium sp. CCMP2456]